VRPPACLGRHEGTTLGCTRPPTAARRCWRAATAPRTARRPSRTGCRACAAEAAWSSRSRCRVAHTSCPSWKRVVELVSRRAALCAECTPARAGLRYVAQYGVRAAHVLSSVPRHARDRAGRHIFSTRAIRARTDHPTDANNTQPTGPRRRSPLLPSEKPRPRYTAAGRFGAGPRVGIKRRARGRPPPHTEHRWLNGSAICRANSNYLHSNSQPWPQK
jgi:hypothetical protein